VLLGKFVSHSARMKFCVDEVPLQCATVPSRQATVQRVETGVTLGTSRKLRARVCGVLLAGAGLLLPTEAKAQVAGMYCDNACLTLALLAIAGTGVSVSADVYYTVRAYAGDMTPQSGRNSIYWTSWQAGILDTIAVWFMDGHISRNDEVMGLLALGTWPLSLTANGMWRGFPESPSARGWAVGMVTFSDAALLGYDALLLGEGRRPKAGLALAEALVGTLQLGFGVITASRADARDRALAWSMTAIPIAMATHGFLALTLPKANANEQARHAQPASTFAALPQFGFAPVHGGMMLQAFGVF